MRRRLTYTLSMVCLGCLLAVLFQNVFEKRVILKSESSAAYKINRIIHYTDKNEIPIFGPSTAQSGFIPSMLGPDYFNYGIDGVREDVLLFFLEHECQKIKANPYIIAVLSADGLSGSLGDINAYLLNSGDPEVRKLMGSRYQFYYHIPFIKYYGQYDNYFKDYLNERMQLTKYKDRGASIEKDVLTKESFDELVHERLNTVTRFRTDSVLLKRLITLLRNNPERKFVFIIPPVHPSYFQKFQNYDDALKFFAYLSSFPNVTVLNYSQNFFPDECYLNTTHLNYDGAVRFNRLIKDTLDKIMYHNADSRNASARADSPSSN